jgi:hypothetical protein
MSLGQQNHVQVKKCFIKEEKILIQKFTLIRLNFWHTINQ